ncbi:MAG: YfhO family protein, partial [Huintestinicola sp.]
LDYYFDNGKMVLEPLGRFAPDEEVSLIVTVTEDKKEVLFKDKLFYYLDEAAFADAVNTLKQHGLVMSEFSEDHIKGTITAEKDGVMFTTISWEPGWTIKVDGEKVEPVKVCDALIGVELTAGQHDIEMSFFPEGLTTGIILTLTGLVSIIIIALTGTKAAKTSGDSSEAA